MITDAVPGTSVLTPRGSGIVLQVVGMASGNGVRVFLMDAVSRGSDAPPLFRMDELEPGPPLPPLSVCDYVTVPGGHPGTVLAVEGDEVLCTYQKNRPRLMAQGRFPHWRLIVSTLAGR